MRKSVFRHILLILVILMLSTLEITYATSFRINSKNVMAADSVTNKPDIDQVKFQQLKAQIEFFKQALDELGATTPEQVVELWAKAEKTRNGVFHYAVACDELKNKIIEELGKPEENYWNIGVSSPWLDKYEIISKKKLTDSSYEVTIKYYWTTSAGPSEPTKNTLVIIKNKDRWCVKTVK